MMKYIFCIALLAPQISLAGFSLNPSYSWYRTDTGTSQSQFELRVGYAFENGLYVGGFYDLVSQKFVELSSDYYVGVHVGYECHGAYGLLGYVVNGDQDMTSGGVKYSGASGVQFTAGYRLLLTEDVYLGPEITYRKVSFKDREISGLAGETNRHDEVLIPGIAVNFAF